MVTNLTNEMLWSAEDVYLDESGEVMIGVGQGKGTRHGKVFAMERSSGGTKTDETVSIFMLTFHVDLCRMYRDIKARFFSGERSSWVGIEHLWDPIVKSSTQLQGKDVADAGQPFFLTSSGVAAEVTKSMFKMFSETVGLPRASANTLRKAGTTNLREDPAMAVKEPVVMDHTKKTADLYYDQGRTSDQVSGSESMIAVYNPS